LSNFSIILDTSNPRFLKEIQAGGNILCDFRIQVNQQAFPSDPWLDFPVIVLAWWLKGYLELIKTNGPVENDFMNGPFLFVSRLIAHNVTLTLWQSTVTNRIELGSAKLALDEYRIELVRAAGHLLNELDRHSVSTPDVSNLRSVLASIPML
jgi:hypothetical protein